MSSPLLEGMRVQTIIPLQLAGLDLSITNAALSMLGAVLGATILLRAMLGRIQLVPQTGQLLAETYYLFIRKLVHQNISYDPERFIPGMFTLFTMILACNLAGLIPGAFGPTTQIVITGTLAAMVFVYTVLLRIRVHGWRFIRAFAPENVPSYVLPLIVPIEVLSFLARPVTLAVRLFANMTAGHSALAVLAMLGWGAPWFLTWLPMGFTVVQLVLEIIIAGIQAYIFTILACVYIDDALVGH